MDKLRAMEVFARVVETGGFTRAADTLDMPKATVTTHIQNLESHLGVKLLNRSTRQVSVTNDGAAYYERCVRILDDVAETENALMHAKKSVRGRLRVDVGATFGREILIPALPEFFARYPDIKLELGCSDRPVDLIEEGVDCVVRGGVQPDSTLVARKLYTLEFVTCATADYLKRHGTPAHPHDLKKHNCVNYFSAKTGRIFDWDFIRNSERIVMTLEGSIALNDSDAYRAAGNAGIGIIKVPELMVAEPLKRGKLKRVLPGWKSSPLPIYVMYPQNRHLSAKVRAFVDWVAGIPLRDGLTG